MFDVLIYFLLFDDKFDGNNIRKRRKLSQKYLSMILFLAFKYLRRTAFNLALELNTPQIKIIHIT